MHKKKCIICERKFESSRSDAKTCGTNCRVKLSKNRAKELIKSQAKEIASWKSKYIEQHIGSGVDKIRMETIRNLLVGKTPDVVCTDNYLLKRIDEGWYSVEKLQ